MNFRSWRSFCAQKSYFSAYFGGRNDCRGHCCLPVWLDYRIKITIKKAWETVGRQFCTISDTPVLKYKQTMLTFRMCLVYNDHNDNCFNKRKNPKRTYRCIETAWYKRYGTEDEVRIRRALNRKCRTGAVHPVTTADPSPMTHIW